jgi:hypothetical protein
VKPWRKLLRAAMALPCGVLGPVLCCAFDLLAAICAEVGELENLM